MSPLNLCPATDVETIRFLIRRSAVAMPLYESSEETETSEQLKLLPTVSESNEACDDDSDSDCPPSLCSESGYANDPPPCKHNQWDNLRAKKDQVSLRCRLCSVEWKSRTLRERKCPDFNKGTCPQGEMCELIHVYRFKPRVSGRKHSGSKNSSGGADRKRRRGKKDSATGCSEVAA